MTSIKEFLRRKRRLVIVAGIVLAAIILPVVWWLASPLFISDVVDEALPFELPSNAEIASMSPAEAEETVMEIMAVIESVPMTESQMEAIEESVMEMAAMMPVHETDEDMPSAAEEWTIAARGDFRDRDAFHRGSGTATIFQLGDQRVLRFENFEVTNGPGLYVFLVENIDAYFNDEIGVMIDLGMLKGNVGNQNYAIPAGINLSDFTGVMIYCVPFHAIFATAPFQ